MKPFCDRNEMFVDTDDEEGEGWEPVTRQKRTIYSPQSTSPQDEILVSKDGNNAEGEVEGTLALHEASGDDSFESAHDETPTRVTAAAGNTEY